MTGMSKAEYIGCCVDNPFGSVDELIEVIDDADKCTKKRFLEEVNIDLEFCG